MSEDITPNKLSPMTKDEVKAMAQAIYDARGKPPYSSDSDVCGTAEELDRYDEVVNKVLSDFVHYWMPFIKQK